MQDQPTRDINKTITHRPTLKTNTDKRIPTTKNSTPTTPNKNTPTKDLPKVPAKVNKQSYGAIAKSTQATHGLDSYKTKSGRNVKSKKVMDM